MHVELKDLQSGAVHRVGPDGATLGRDPSRCSIVVADKGVSGLHARIQMDGQRFVLSDAGSSNGTFVGVERLQAPLPLYSGATFALFRYRFEVGLVAIDEEDTGALGKPGERRPDAGEAPSRAQRQKTSSRSGPPNTASQVSAVSPVPSPRTEPDPRGAPAARGPTTRRARPQGDMTGLVSLSAFAASYYSHYLPRLVLHPVDAVEASVRDPRHGPMTTLELVGWAMPAFAFAAFCAGLGACVAQLAAGESLWRLVIVMTLALALGGGLAIVSALLWHPVASFVLEISDAEHDAGARSNLFVDLMTAVPAMGFGSLVTAVLASLPLPYAALLGVAATLMASLLALYVLYGWMRHLEASSLALGGVGVLAALVVLGTGWNGALVARAQLELASSQVDGAPPGIAGPASSSLAAASPPSPTVAPPSSPPSPYAEYQQRRAAIEKLIEADPSVLKRKVGVLDLYRRLHAETGKVEARHAATREDVVQRRVRDAELYDATVGIVDALFGLVAPAQENAPRR